MKHPLHPALRAMNHDLGKMDRGKAMAWAAHIRYCLTLHPEGLVGTVKKERVIVPKEAYETLFKRHSL